MKHVPHDGSGSEDDPPPSNQYSGARGCNRGTGRTSGASEQNNMETLTHQLEQEAYRAVLLAFMAQSDSVTWERASLMTNLRKVLRVSSEEDKELQNRANADDIMHRIREFRHPEGGVRSGLLDNAQPLHHSRPSSTISTAHSRRTTFKSIPSPSLDALPSQTPITPMQPSSSAAKLSTGVGAKSKKPSDQVKRGVVVMKSVQFPSSGPIDKSRVGPAEGVPISDPYQLRGQIVMKRRPEDNYFHGTLIRNCDSASGRHALDYFFEPDAGEEQRVDFNEVHFGDIQWEDKCFGNFQLGQSGPDHQNDKNSMDHLVTIPCLQRGRGFLKAQPDFPPNHNDIVKKNFDEIEMFHTDYLLEEQKE